MSLEMIVCVKQVPDPEGPPTSFEIDKGANRVHARGIPPVISSFDENALELAIRLKETYGGSITLISIGKSLSKAVFIKALGTGADRLLTVESDELDPQGLDSHSTASLLAAAMHLAGPYDLILTGRQAADTNAGQVGLGLAQIIGIPAISLVKKVEMQGERLRVERILPDGYEVLECKLPALLTVSHEGGELRYPPLQALKAAKSLPHQALSLEDLGIDIRDSGLLRLERLSAPARERNCVMVNGENPEETGTRLALRLREDKII
jgi:electron transfer flavoprotein beta subunit